MLAIAGYDSMENTGDRLLVDGTELTSKQLFWPLHLGSCLPEDEAQALAFGPDWDDAMGLYAKISDRNRWPVLTVEWGRGYAVHVVYRNHEDDRGVDYLFAHPEWDAVATIAVDDGHFMGPGLSWNELEAVADRSADRGVADADARLLLLFPMLGDTNVPREAAGRLASALASRTRIEDPDRLAPMLLEHQGQWTPANWELVDGALVCDGTHSYRNPRNHFALHPTRLTEISTALNLEEI